MSRSPLFIIALIAATLGACAAQDEPLDPAATHTSASNAEARFEGGALAPDRLLGVKDIQTPTQADCGVKGVPVLGSLEGYWTEYGQVGVVIRGQSCAAEINSFGFSIFDAEGNDVSGRSWPEVDEIHMEEDGSFTLRGVAASCGDVSRGVRVEVLIHLPDGARSESVQADIR